MSFRTVVLITLLIILSELCVSRWNRV